eukprot:15154445-Ditylum_brightwellii.AAC.1
MASGGDKSSTIYLVPEVGERKTPLMLIVTSLLLKLFQTDNCASDEEMNKKQILFFLMKHWVAS